MPIRCALVGLGDFGQLHARVLDQSPLATLAVCCDRDPERAARTPPGSAFVTELEQALAVEGLEAVWCCTPPTAHREVVEAALARGLDVFCEKPLAGDLDDADAMIAAAGTEERLKVGHLYRLDPRFTALADALAGPELGAVLDLAATSHTPRADAARALPGVTVTLENSVHLIDVFQWLAGPATRVSAEARADGSAVAATLRFRDGAVGTLLSSWGMAEDSGIDWGFELTCNAERGLATVDGRSRGVSIHSAAAPALYPNPFSWPDVLGRVGGLLAAEDERFLLAVRDRSIPWPLDLVAARQALATALAVDEAARTGTPVEIP